MQKIYLLSLIAIFSMITGCAHNINITPPTINKSKVEIAPKTVGFFISTANKAKQVESPGGGGDRVSYAPYRDLESLLFGTLMRVYANVEPLSSLEQAAGKPLSLVFIPEIETDSSSSSALTWPPTDFKVTINMKTQDPAGKVLWTESVTGNGKAEFSEFKNDYSLSAKRAAQDAIDKLEVALRKREGLN